MHEYAVNVNRSIKLNIFITYFDPAIIKFKLELINKICNAYFAVSSRQFVNQSFGLATGLTVYCFLLRCKNIFILSILLAILLSHTKLTSGLKRTLIDTRTRHLQFGGHH